MLGPVPKLDCAHFLKAANQQPRRNDKNQRDGDFPTTSAARRPACLPPAGPFAPPSLSPLFTFERSAAKAGVRPQSYDCQHQREIDHSPVTIDFVDAPQTLRQEPASQVSRE